MTAPCSVLQGSRCLGGAKIQKNMIKTYNGDCMKIMPEMESGSVDLVLTDPPYMISRETNFQKGGGNHAKYGSINMDFGDWDHGEGIDMGEYLQEVYRLLKQNGTIVMFYDIFKMETIRNIADKIGFKQPRIGIWNKTNAVPINARINYLSNAREYFISFCKGKKGTFNSYYDKAMYNYPIVSGKERVHPTQKPIGLMRELIAVHSKPGDMVMDTFFGSGVVLDASSELGRECIGIEIDQQYYSNYNKRHFF